MSQGGARQTSGGTPIEQRARLEHPFADVWASMLAHSSPRLPAEDVSGGEALVGLRVAGLPVYKHVRLEIGEPTVPDDSRRVVLPIRWRPTGLAPVFPDLDGELTFEPLGVERTLVTLTGSYR
ncbi:MAG: hypothetical protein J2P45_28765, partial [Candidatus Dormibacteraeota bacterium]|nr:hypothetical protein [Candidatus Dormibacteraeota bacterium]